MSKILKEFDKNYKINRARLISNNYEEIVASNLHENININLLKRINISNIKELIKFDFMTNVNNTGDRHITLHFFDEDNTLQRVHIVLNTDDWEELKQSDNYILINDKRTEILNNTFELQEVKNILFKMLDIFRRGYDKPKI